MKKILFVFLPVLFLACNSDKPEITREEVYNQFIDCKATTEDKHGCKEYVAMLIDAQYGISDFDMGDSYLPYDELIGVINSSDKWVNIGFANDQDVLAKAQEYSNDGRAVLVMNPDKPGIAIIMPGELTHSSGWELDVPNCAFLHMKKPEKSFLDNTLAYAFGKAKGLMVYARD